MPIPVDALQMPDPDALVEELTEEAEKEDAIEEAPVKKIPDKKLADKSKEEYTFQFDWRPVGADGKPKPGTKRWSGTFTTKILTVREKQLVGLMRARLSGGSPFESLDPLTNEINLIVAHLSFCLTQKPDWAKELTSIKDIRVLQEIYMEVASHEAIFHG